MTYLKPMRKTTILLGYLLLVNSLSAQTPKSALPAAKKAAAITKPVKPNAQKVSPQPEAPYLLINDGAIKSLIYNNAATIELFKGAPGTGGYIGKVFLFRSALGNGQANIFDFSKYGGMSYFGSSPSEQNSTLVQHRKEMIRLKEQLNPNGAEYYTTENGEDKFSFFCWNRNEYVRVDHYIDTVNSVSKLFIMHYNKVPGNGNRILIDSTFDNVIRTARETFDPLKGEREGESSWNYLSKYPLLSYGEKVPSMITYFYNKPVKAMFSSSFYPKTSAEMFRLIDEIKTRIHQRYPKVTFSMEVAGKGTFFIFENFFPDEPAYNGLFKVELGYFDAKEPVVEIEFRQKSE